MASSRAVLGRAVSSGQALEVQHQAAKQFFKEVSCGRGGPGCRWQRDGPAHAPVKSSAHLPPLNWGSPLDRPPPSAATLCTSLRNRSAAACPGSPTTTGWRS